MNDRKVAAIVIGTFEPDAVKKGDALTPRTLEMLEGISNRCGIDVDLVFVSMDELDAGRNKATLGIQKIRKERGRVLSEIDEGKPDLVICMGPVATACLWDKGNMVESELLRQSHDPLGTGLPVFVTFSLEAVRWKAGLSRWLEMDIEAAVHGYTTTEWGDYTVLQPGTPEWRNMPDDLRLNDGDVVGMDLETYPGLDPNHPEARIRMAVVSDKVGRAWILQATPDSEFPPWFKDMCEDHLVCKTGSNIKFDYKWLRRFGIRMRNMADTSTREHIIDESNPKKDLKSLTFRYVPKLGDYSKQHRDLVRERGGWEHVTDEEQYQYCGGDGEASIGTYLGQEPLLKGNNLDRPWGLMKKLYEVLAEVEHRGVRISRTKLEELDVLYKRKLVKLRAEITEVLGPINVNSPKQLAVALKEAVPDIKLTEQDWKRAVTADDSDDRAVTKRMVLEREAHKHPIIPIVLEFRKYRTRHSTFIKGILEKYGVVHNGGLHIHPSYRTDVVETFRLSSQAPNGQNIPRKDNDDPELTVKKMYCSRFDGGSFMEGDQSQIEIRTAAWLSQDKKMLEAIDSGEDIHTAMAGIMLAKDINDVTEEERQLCKARTFLILYGGGAKKLSQDLKVSRRAAQRLIDDYFETFTGLRDYIQQTKNRVKIDLQVTTPFGFTRKFNRPERWDSSEGFRIERQAFNTIVQSTAACITYLAMIRLEDDMRAAGLKSLMVGQVHDSILIDVYPGEENQVSWLMKSTMENAGDLAREYGVEFDVPLNCDVELGTTWGEQKKLVLTTGGSA
jgi:DNA polymerase-1